MRNKLTASFCEKITKAGRYADGGSLYLLVKPHGGKSWVFRWRDRITGKLRDKGLGRYGADDVTLKEARQGAARCRRLLRDNLDPIAEKTKAREAQKLEYLQRMTFEDCLTQYVDSNKAKWSKKHVMEWPSSLYRYCDRLMDLPVSDIDTRLVIKCLEPHWGTTTETMTRVRQRLEAVLAWATVREFRSGDNPAQWKNHLDKVLPEPTKLKNIQHHAAMPYTEIGDFMVKLREKKQHTARALELQILCAARPGEVTNATWSEFDLDKKIWTIDASRMKAGKDHEIPLSDVAVELLQNLPRVSGSDWVFNGARQGRPVTTASVLKALRTIRPELTSHGFRSSFREFAGEQTSFSRDVIEHALAHSLPNKVEASYYRRTQLPKRVKLMAAWAKYCGTVQTKADNVTPIGKQA